MPAHRKDNNRVKLFAGLISGSETNFTEARKFLERKYGAVDLASAVLPFAHTDYYEEEFGPGLKRIFFSFKKLARRENIYKSKLVTNSIEIRLSLGATKRVVNIDPGYLTLDKIVLFTTKNYTHRIYLSRGIYAEATLKFEGKSYAPWPWTYPDYKTQQYIDFFNRMREIYKKDLSPEN